MKSCKLNLRLNTPCFSKNPNQTLTKITHTFNNLYFTIGIQKNKGGIKMVNWWVKKLTWAGVWEFHRRNGRFPWEQIVA